MIANNSTHPDLFQALKGGGNNFGIVTRFNLMTFSQPTIWGGLKVISESALPDLIPAFVNFTDSMAKYSDGSLITNWLYNSTIKSTFLVNVLAYSGNFTGDVPTAFENITSLGPDVLNTLDYKDMVDLTSETEQASGQRWVDCHLTSVIILLTSPAILSLPLLCRMIRRPCRKWSTSVVA